MQEDTGLLMEENYLLAYYKKFFARIWFDDASDMWIGRVMDTDDVLVFDGKTLEEALSTFHGGIEEYIKNAGGAIKGRNTQVLNLIRHGMENPDFINAARELLYGEDDG